ncbi:MAG: DUF2490 domain-containing protein [Oceanipulchritudo sp.]
MKPPLKDFLLVLFLCLPGASAFSGEPWQIWFSAQVKASFSEEMTFTFSEESRFSTEGRGLRRQSFQPIMDWKARDYLSFGLGGEYGHKWNGSGKESTYQEGIFYFTLSHQWNRITLSSRQRVEAGESEGNAQSEFRHKLVLAYSPRDTAWIPYISNEWFWDLSDDTGLKGNRLGLGTRYKFATGWQANAFLMLQHKWDSNNKKQHIPVGSLTIRYHF